MDEERKELREVEGLESMCGEVEFLGVLSQVTGWEIHTTLFLYFKRSGYASSQAILLIHQ